MTNQFIAPRMETIGSSAKLVNLPPYYIRQLVLTGRVKYVKAGKKYWLNFESLVEYLQNGDEPKKLADSKCPIRAVEV